MSFFGKKFKKVNISDEIVAINATLNLTEKALKLIQSPDLLFTYVDNGDGTYNYDQFIKDDLVVSQKFTPGKEQESADGLHSKITIDINGDTVKTTIKENTGKVLYINRVFNGNKATMELTIEGDSRKGTVTYEAV